MVLRRQLLTSLGLAFVLCAFLGYRYPASDMLLLLPFIEHGVIPGDLYFSSVPPQYAFVIWFLRLASHVMPLVWFCAGLIYAAAVMIMFGLVRLIEAITCKPVNFLVAAAVTVATGVEATLLLRMKRLIPQLRFVEVPLVLRYDKKEGGSSIRIFRTIWGYLKLAWKGDIWRQCS